MTHDEADDYCQNIGARLPSDKEFIQLAEYLGRHKGQGYSPYQADGKTDPLPEFYGRFWSASVVSVNLDNAWVFNTGDGYVHGNNRHGDYRVRCVGR